MVDSQKCVLVIEMNWGQMVEDVKLAVGDRLPIHFYGKHGGLIFTPGEIENLIKVLQGDPKHAKTLWTPIR